MKKVNIKKTRKKVVEKKETKFGKHLQRKIFNENEKKTKFTFRIYFPSRLESITYRIFAHSVRPILYFFFFFICLEIYSTYYTLQTYTHTPIWIKLDSRNHYIFDNDDSFLFFLLLHFFSTFSFFFVWFHTHTHRSGIVNVPENAKAHYNYGNLQQDLGNWNDAIYHYQTAIR